MKVRIIFLVVWGFVGVRGVAQGYQAGGPWRALGFLMGYCVAAALLYKFYEVFVEGKQPKEERMHKRRK